MLQRTDGLARAAHREPCRRIVAHGTWCHCPLHLEQFTVRVRDLVSRLAPRSNCSFNVLAWPWVVHQDFKVLESDLVGDVRPMRLQLSLHVILKETIWLVLTRCGGHVFVRIAGEQRSPTCIEMTNGLVHGRGVHAPSLKRIIAILLAHVARLVIQRAARHGKAAIIDTEPRLLQAGVVSLVDMRHRALVLVVDGEEAMLLAKVAVALVYLRRLGRIDCVRSVGGRQGNGYSLGVLSCLLDVTRQAHACIGSVIFLVEAVVDVDKASLLALVELAEALLGDVEVAFHREVPILGELWVPTRGADQLKLGLVLEAGAVRIDWLVHADAWRVFGMERVQVILVDTIVNDAAAHREARFLCKHLIGS